MAQGDLSENNACPDKVNGENGDFLKKSLTKSVRMVIIIPVLNHLRVCWNWQTGTFEGRVFHDVRVQVPSLAVQDRTGLFLVVLCGFFLPMTDKKKVQSGYHIR